LTSIRPNVSAQMSEDAVRRLAKITWPFSQSPWYAGLYAEPKYTGHHSEVCHPESTAG
jgi:hypothetical protein